MLPAGVHSQQLHLCPHVTVYIKLFCQLQLSRVYYLFQKYQLKYLQENTCVQFWKEKLSFEFIHDTAFHFTHFCRQKLENGMSLDFTWFNINYSANLGVSCSKTESIRNLGCGCWMHFMRTPSIFSEYENHSLRIKGASLLNSKTWWGWSQWGQKSNWLLLNWWAVPSTIKLKMYM